MKALLYMAGIVTFSGLLLVACMKKDIVAYEQDARIYFRIPGQFDGTVTRDSLIYSFPFHPTVTDHDTIWFQACIMGSPAAADREIDFRIDADGTTAKENVDFKFVTKVVPAGAFKANMPIVIYKTAALKNSSVR